jgi:hypothetical protein
MLLQRFQHLVETGLLPSHALLINLVGVMENDFL